MVVMLQQEGQVYYQLPRCPSSVVHHEILRYTARYETTTVKHCQRISYIHEIPNNNALIWVELELFRHPPHGHVFIA
jgi:hypothetical protein